MTATPNQDGGVSLGETTARGVAWLVGQTAIGKAVSLLGQIVLARLLIPEQFGLFALAMTVVAFAGLIRQGGVLQILIQRHDRFNRWATPAFWIALCAGIVAGLFVLGMIPLTVRIYDEPRLIPIMLILALEAPIAALEVVPSAKLRIDMRFRLIAGVGIGTAILQYALMITLAAAGFGALSFAIPRPVIAAIQTTCYWIAARPRVRLNPMLRRWKFLLRDSVLVMLAIGAFTATQQGDYMVLGFIFDAPTVGIYFFAFALSMQTIALLTSNLQAVLLPALSKLKDDPVRQANATVRAARVLALIACPLCLCQAAAADPVFRLLFDDKWQAAVPIFQILTLAMAFRTALPPAGNLIQASGRFGVYFAYHSAAALIFFALIIPGAFRYGGIGVAWAVLIHAAITLTIAYAIAVRPARLPALIGLGIIVPPLIPAGLAAVTAWYVAGLLPLGKPTPSGASGVDMLIDVARVVIVGVIGLGGYAVILRIAMPRRFAEIVTLAARFLPLPPNRTEPDSE